MRRVGKTTILNQLIASLLEEGVDSRNILYVSFDNPIFRLVSPQDIFDVYETLYPVDGMKYIFFDEVQYAEDWELWIKVMYDSRKDIRLVATGSASPILEKGSADSGTGRWNIIKVPTMSFYEYCRLLKISEPKIPANCSLSDLESMDNAQLGDFMNRFSPLQAQFNRYLTIGGFPELALSSDDKYAQRMLREDVVDKVLKRDILTLFNIRNPFLMEKLFLYLCITSSNIFNVTTAAKELENISVSTIESYISALEMSNLIYISKPVNVGKKGALKGKPKIYVADAAIRNAVLMNDDILADDAELGVTVETAVYKHLASFFRNLSIRPGYFRKAADNQKEVDVVVELLQKKVLFEVKYRSDSHVTTSDAIVDLCSAPGTNISNAFLITKRISDFGISKQETNVPIMRVPAIAFLYILGKAEADGCAGKL